MEDEINIDETYSESAVDEDIVYHDGMNLNDFIFIGTLVLVALLIFAFVMRKIKKTFKRVNLKVGNLVHVEIETKDNTIERKIASVDNNIDDNKNK